MAKTCTKCGVEYADPEAAFHRCHAAPDGLQRECRRCRNAIAMEWYRANRDRARAAMRANYLRDHEASKRARREYAAKDRTREVQRVREWRAKNADVRRQYVLQEGCCFWCGRLLIVGRPRFHVDHLIPLRRGGSNWPWNIVLACATCNCSRKDRLPLEWAPSFARPHQTA